MLYLVLKNIVLQALNGSNVFMYMPRTLMLYHKVSLVADGQTLNLLGLRRILYVWTLA